MRSAARFCLMGLVCLLLTGCPPVPPQQVLVPPRLTCDQNSSGSDFVAAKVSKLSASFVPTRLEPPTQSDILGSVTPSDPYWKDLVAAFAAASPAFRDNLCNLDGVFVVQNTCAATGCTHDDVINNSWGFRQKVAQPNRYIAVSAALWANGTAPIFSEYENMRLSILLNKLNRNAAAWFSLLGSRPHFGPASPDTSTMTVLAILAHEYGHVYWYDAFVSPPGGSFNGSRFCGGKFYSSDAWTSIAVPSPRWIAFGEQVANQSHRPNHLPELVGHLAHANFGRAGDTLRMILTDKELVTTLANFSPIEDFVESYQLFVLRSANPPLASFTIQIDGLQPFDILRQIVDKQGLKRKFACFLSPAVQR